ncbi:MAG: site-2 protease family protein [Pseudomonadota bacterium]
MNDQVDDFPLPELRSDLQLIEGPVALDGSPSWLIFDPLRNKYFSIGWAAFQLLSRWSIGQANSLLNKLKTDTSLDVNHNDVKSMIDFLLRNSLTRDSASGSSEDYLEQYNAGKSSVLNWLIHHYLFFKIPLVKPTSFLRKTLIYVEPFFSSTARALVLLLGIVGLFMVGRQWESFLSTFMYFFNFQGLVFYFISLVFIKVLHELAHAYVATHYGCKVPTMGVAFLVMFPILYTDTSDTWRVRSAKERVHVGAAGIMMELYVACIATFMWSFLPDGYLKSAAFILATTSWIMSLAINLNALMRFDGYYIMSDLIGIQNLQSRSFDVGKWRLTEVLFGLRLEPPEALPKDMLHKLTIYAWCVWVYRFFLFIGIALLVYHFFFKVLGLFLFAIEILWFILMPVSNMIKYWWDLRMDIVKSRRFYITLFFSAIGLLLLLVPWQSSVSIPAMLQSGQKLTLYSQAPAYIENNYLIDKKQVSTGDVLIILRSPKLEQEIDLAEQQIELLKLKAKRIAASKAELENVQVIIQQLQESRSRLGGLLQQAEQLVVRAPFTGTIYDTDSALHAGRWINVSTPLANLVETTDAVIEAVLDEEQLKRVELQTNAKFIPDNPELKAIWGYVGDIEEANLRTLDLKPLASVYGGDVPVTQDADNQLVPDRSIYRVRIPVSLVENIQLEQVIRGVVHVEAESASFITRLYRTVASVLIRESGF